MGSSNQILFIYMFLSLNLGLKLCDSFSAKEKTKEVKVKAADSNKTKQHENRFQKVGSGCLDQNTVWCQKYKRRCKDRESIQKVCKKTCGLCDSDQLAKRK